MQDREYDDRDARARPYGVMDYFPGTSLQVYLDHLGEKGVLTLEDFVRLSRPGW